MHSFFFSFLIEKYPRPPPPPPPKKKNLQPEHLSKVFKKNQGWGKNLGSVGNPEHNYFLACPK